MAPLLSSSGGNFHSFIHSFIPSLLFFLDQHFPHGGIFITLNTHELCSLVNKYKISFFAPPNHGLS